MKLTPFCAACFVFLLMSTAKAQSPAVAEKPEFRALVPAGTVVEKLAGGFQFTEGPAWDPKENLLVFSDIPGDRLLRYHPGDGKVSVFRCPSHNANGNFYDASDNLFTCEHGSRAITMTSLIRSRWQGTNPGPNTRSRDLPLDVAAEGELVADRYEGKRFNSPNDIVVKSDGTIWFTDPTYGLAGGSKEQTANRVYCFEPKTGVLRAVADGFDQPNGLCFSPDETRLYVADSGQPRHVRVFDVNKDGHLSNGRVFCAIDKGVPDGMRCDRHGNLFSTAGEGIQVFSPAGERLGMIPVPETPANLCFGGPAWDDLYITARTSLYRIRLTTAAAGK